jgi:hypothetical protein
MRLDTDSFLKELQGLCQAVNDSAKHAGAVYITQKIISSEYAGGPGDVLVRATNGKRGLEKKKISTIVGPGNSPAFYSALTRVCKASMLLKRKG